MRRCKLCGVEKTLEEFVPNKRSVGGREHSCTVCTVLRRKKRKQARKILAREYLGNSCNACGFNQSLQFHHKDPSSKSFIISQALWMNWKDLKDELNKCLLLCGNCHAVRHFKSPVREVFGRALRDRERVRERKLECLEYLGGACTTCGYNEYSCALQFHHVNPKEKSFHIGDRCNMSLEKLKPELDKCQILCVNCHNELHH